MLATFLEAHREELLRGVKSRQADDGELALRARESLEQIDALMGSLIKSLQQGDASKGSTVSGVSDGAVEFAQRHLLRREVLAQIEQRGMKVEMEEMAILSDWIYAADRDRMAKQYRRLCELLDDTNDAAAILAPDGRFEYVNRRLARELHETLGVPPAQVLGETPAQLRFPPSYSTRSIDCLQELARSHASEEFLWQGRWKEGQLKAIYAPEGDVAALALVVCDIHDPKLAHMRTELLSKLSALVGTVDYEDVAEALARVPVPELADWCAVHLVENGRIVHTSVAHPPDPAKTPLRDALHRAIGSWKRHPLWVEIGLTSGFQLLTEVSDDLLHQLAGGEEQYRLLSEVGVQSVLVQPVFSRGQTVALFTLVFTRESGRRYDDDHPPMMREVALHAAHLIENARLLRELRVNNARFRVALAGARTVVFEQDASLRYVWYYNPIDTESLVGKTHEEAFEEQEAAVLTELKRRALEHGEHVHQEVAVTSGGRRGQYRQVTEPLRNSAGKIVGVIGSATDITEEKETQHQLRENLSLRDEMIAILGHDLLNPLNTVHMTASVLLRRPDLAEDVRKKMMVIERASGRMAEMIHTLRELARVGSFGKVGMSPAPVDLGDIVHQVVDEQRAARVECSIELDLQGDLHGEGDAPRLAQVVSNLVSNALIHGHERGPVHVAVSGEPTELTLKVKNEGPPIPGDVIPQLFDPSHRRAGDDSRSGFGLGLFIVRQIVVGHGGTIDVESSAEAGTTFTVRLPRTTPQKRSS
jgi:signal transduction histidine kinase